MLWWFESASRVNIRRRTPQVRRQLGPPEIGAGRRQRRSIRFKFLLWVRDVPWGRCVMELWASFCYLLLLLLIIIDHQISPLFHILAAIWRWNAAVIVLTAHAIARPNGRMALLQINLILRPHAVVKIAHVLGLSHYGRLLPRVEKVTLAYRLILPACDLRRFGRDFQFWIQALPSGCTEASSVFESSLKFLNLLFQLHRPHRWLPLPRHASIAPFIFFFHTITDKLEFTLITVIKKLMVLNNVLLFTFYKLFVALPFTLRASAALNGRLLILLILFHFFIGAQVTGWIVQHLH